jgi:hypothetical protein
MIRYSFNTEKKPKKFVLKIKRNGKINYPVYVCLGRDIYMACGGCVCVYSRETRGLRYIGESYIVSCERLRL